MNCQTRYRSPIGSMTLSADGDALTGLWFDGQKHFGSTLPAEAAEADLPIFDLTRRWLDAYFDGRDPGFTPPLRLHATAFQEEVYGILLSIPYGRTSTYGAIAHQMAERHGTSSAPCRAVGAAVGRNPISLIIPCHRVLGAGGRLHGYAGGLERKQHLLTLENTNRYE